MTKYTRETAAQRARLDKVMHAKLLPDDELPIQFAGPEPTSADWLFDWMGDMAAAGRIVLIWLLVVVACGLAAYLIAAGIDAIEPHWAVAVAMLGV